jgi:hypothetical protein
MFSNFLRFVAGYEEPIVRHHSYSYTDTMLIHARNEVGEVITMEVPAPIRSDLRPGLTSPVVRNQTFARYDTTRDQT